MIKYDVSKLVADLLLISYYNFHVGHEGKKYKDQRFTATWSTLTVTKDRKQNRQQTQNVTLHLNPCQAKRVNYECYKQYAKSELERSVRIFVKSNI